jgi:uncharacterized membrane protein
MFDLTEQLRLWRARFASTHALRGADLDELEQHVHDAMPALTALGLNEEEAFLVATHRVGDPRPVAEEYRKVNGSSLETLRAFWMLLGFLVFQIVGLAIASVAPWGRLLAELAGGKYLAGFASVVVTATCWLLIARWLIKRSRADGEEPGIANRALQSSCKKIALSLPLSS